MSKYPNSEAEGHRTVPTVSALALWGRVCRPYKLITLTLALLTTMTSAGIAIMSGWQRAVGHPQQAACVALAVVAVIAAHLLPALASGKSLLVRLSAIFLCVASLIITLYGQTSFFLLTQRAAGNQRAMSASLTTVNQLSTSAPARDPVTIAEDEERVRGLLATNDARHCEEGCLAQQRRHDLLEAKLHTLAIEEYEAKRHEVVTDRLADSSKRLRDFEREDVVTARLARAIGGSEQTLNWLLALLCACVLDCTGSFCWYLIFHSGHRIQVTDTNQVVATITPDLHERVASDGQPVHNPCSSSVDDDDGRLARLLDEVAAGRVRPTINGIREHFNCAQKTAAQLRRRYQAICKAMQAASF